VSVIASVIVNIASSEVDRCFDYIVPPKLGPKARVGSRVRVPFGRRTVEGYIIALGTESSIPAERLRAISDVPDAVPPLTPEMIKTAKWMCRQYYCTLADALKSMLPPQLRGDATGSKLVRWAVLKCTAEEAQQAAEQLKKRAPRQAEALLALVEAGGSLQSSLLEAQSGVLKSLEEKGLVELAQRQVYRRPQVETGEGAPEHMLTPDQQRARDAILKAVGKGGSFLLHGVTGSGKTEVYMQCAGEALKRGLGAIILVPEIALTPQMTARFCGRFGDRAAVLHSRLSDGERYDEWQRIRSGQAQIVIGARSAIFAPISNIGLIVVDEEHETSYISEHSPRYDAVETARFIAGENRAALVVGSATPSVVRYYAAEQGEWTLINMPSRISGHGMPPAYIVDMREELAKGNRSVFSRRLLWELKDCLSRGEQAILLMNRRGYSTFVSCRSCGHVMKCPACDVSMTYHRTNNMLMCHYCGHQEHGPSVCPACGSRYIKYFGGGTQKVEEELNEKIPGIRVLRMDADTTRTRNAHQQILSAFGRGEADVLLGTQMIAKGLDFANVTLVGVVAADQLLHMADFRSSERGFQLIAQVAGRAGRDEKAGRVVVQTYDPEHFSIQAAAQHDYQGFYGQEIETRRLGMYPPFADVLRAMVVNGDAVGCRSDAMKILKAVQSEINRQDDLKEAVLMLQMTAAPIERINEKYRTQVIAKVLCSREGRRVRDIFAAAVADKGYKSSVWLEINPNNML